MPTPAPAARSRADACPGVLAPHDAADGALARLRLPGGVVAAAQLRVLAACAEELGDGAVHLTSRGNLQLRGLNREDPRLVSRLAAAGLIPAPSHERVRNVLASPLSGLTGGRADVRGLARALDEALCARPALAALPGRFLFALDDGRGDVAAERPDLCWVAEAPDLGFLQVAGVPTALSCVPADAPALLVAAAEVFLTLREEERPGCAGAWRAAEVPDAPARIAAALARESGDPAPRVASSGTASREFPHRESGDPAARVASSGSASRELCESGVPIGPIPRDDGGEALGVAPVLGEISVAQLRGLAAAAPETIVTPWRTLVLPDPAPDARQRLRAHGFVLTADAPALAVSACAGRPGCAKSHADVRADVREVLGRARELPRAHVVGCERRCGAPHEAHLDVVALPDGTYRLGDRTVPDLSTALSVPAPTGEHPA
ncbi:nitrite/sulfite reductase [Pseudonocardia halophobica]|uniref:Precorrin-3B synthase n=1 Tax=Pseudonocardia halophobica TaxID=29401 RepID=A0A9W6P1G6_9PSEU|nr:precorrin-3B synthase [Pseudonocardia halophobica]GLL16047.1 precorrin-3B synthase [Pseudonocardia halophobica]